MANLPAQVYALRSWLFTHALPLWWELGADRVRGGFHEAIDLAGEPLAHPRRARSIARQVFSYCKAGQLGWDGPWREAAEHALKYFRNHYVRRDGTIDAVVDLGGRCSEPRLELYNQAFGLLAYASAHAEFGEGGGWRELAVRLRTTLQEQYAHPGGGFVEARADPQMQSANPHMHLLEAALAWMGLDPDPGWRRMADSLVTLCLATMIDQKTSALREFFDADWRPAPGVAGSICEPGHHYEWAFLLHRWAHLAHCPIPEPASRLIAFADAHGVDPIRGVAVNAVLVDGRMHDPVARLWAQAERIRAYLVAGRDDAQIASAVAGLRRFLAVEKQGLWFDQLDANDRFVEEPARATSLYHIVGALSELTGASNAAEEVHQMQQRRENRAIVRA